MNSLLKEFENDKDYLKALEYYIINYETIINVKKARKRNEKSKKSIK